MNDDEKESLGLLTTEDLLGELSKRFDHLVFCGLIDRGQQEAAVCRHYRGNSHLCMGLAYDVAQLALDDLLDRASPDVPQGDGEDDEE